MSKHNPRHRDVDFRKTFENHWRHLTNIGCNDQPDAAKESVFYWARWGYDRAQNVPAHRTPGAEHNQEG